MIKWIRILIFSMLLVEGASGATLTVDDSGGANYTKIQDAINNASAGDTILVYSGTYYENVNVNKQLIMLGIDAGGGKPIVNASGIGSAITINADSSTLNGFMATGGGLGTEGGIKINSKNNIIINNNGSINAGYGIYLHSSNNNIISNNTALYNNIGFMLDFSDNNTFIDNTATNSFTGIYLWPSSNNNFSRNTVSNNMYGIFVDSSGSNTIFSNLVSKNNNGIYLHSSGGIVIYHNNILNNTNNAFDDTSNQWDNGVIGNHYSSFDEPSEGCTDANGNGICDSSYNIIGGSSVDRYPLVSWSLLVPPPNSIGYSALVATGQNTFVQSSNGSFGLLLKSQSKTLNNSVILNNTGDISAKVEARFNDSVAGVFGLISGTNVLNATNFALGIPSSLVPLNNSGADVHVAVAPLGVTALDARLGVPNEQAAGDYSGTVVLTFSNNV